MIVSGLAMSHSLSIREVERRHLDRGPVIIKGDKNVCCSLQAWLEGVVSKKLNAPYRSGPSRTLDQSQKSKSASSNASNRGNFLTCQKTFPQGPTSLTRGRWKN